MEVRTLVSPFASGNLTHLVEALPSLVKLVVSFLGKRDVIMFEKTNKKHPSLTTRFWEDLRKKEFLYFNWSDCQTSPHPEKANYLLSTFFIFYIAQRANIVRNISSLENIMHALFPFLGQRYPNFSCYLKNDIKGKNQKPSIDIAQAIKNELGGDILFQTFIQIRKKGFSIERYQNLMHAIGRGATCASILVKKVTNVFDERHLFFLAHNAAVHKDERALDGIFRHKTFEQIIELVGEQTTLSCALRHLFEKAPNIEQKERILDRAIKLPKPTEALIEIYIKLKVSLKKFPEIDALSYRLVCPTQVLGEVALTKFMLEKYQEADSLYTKYFNSVFPKYTDQPDHYLLAAKTKLHLGHYEDCERLFKKIPERLWTTDFSICAAENKVKLRKYDEADKIYSEILKYMTSKDPRFVNILSNAASVKYCLHQYKEADVIYQRALDHCKVIFSPDILRNAARIKFILGKYEEANTLFDQAFMIDSNVKAGFLAIAGTTKLIKGSFSSAERLYERALEKYGQGAASRLKISLAITKFKLHKFQEAEMLYQSVLDQEPRPPLIFLLGAALNKTSLGKNEQADKLYDSVLKHGVMVPYYFLNEASRIKLLLGQMANAKLIQQRARNAQYFREDYSHCYFTKTLISELQDKFPDRNYDEQIKIPLPRLNFDLCLTIKFDEESYGKEE